MVNKGDRRQSFRWRVPDPKQKRPLIGAWHRQRSNNSHGMGEALPPGSTLISIVELERPGSEVTGYRLFLYSDGQGWIGGTDGEGLPKGLDFPFSIFEIDGSADRVLAGGRIQPTNDPIIFYHRSSKTNEVMIKIGHTNVSGYYTRCYMWITYYECTEEWDGARWVEVAA